VVQGSNENLVRRNKKMNTISRDSNLRVIWVPFYYSTYAKCKVTQLIPNLINFKSLIMSKK